jgi:diguanylate cyclase (GGDEF)-like protein
MTLRTKTALLLALIISLGIAASGVFHLHFLEQSLRRSILQGVESVCQSTVDTIDKYLTERLADTQVMAALLPESLLQQQGTAGLETYLQTMAGLYPQFENGLFILDPAGNLLADYPIHPEVRGRNYAYREYYQRTLQEQRGIIGKPYVSTRTGLPVLTFTAVLRGPDRQVSGLLMSSVQLSSPDALGGISRLKFGETGYSYVFDGTRRLILHPDPQRVGKRDVPQGANRLFDAALKGFEGAGRTVNSRGIGMLAAFQRLQSMDWIVAVQQPEAEAYAPIRLARRKLLLILFASALLAAVIGTLVIRRVTLPIARLQKVARQLEHVGEGGETSASDVSRTLDRLNSDDEIGALARAMRTLHGRLEQTLGALRSSARDWEQTFHSVQDAIFIVDQDYRIQRMNTAARRLFQTRGEKGNGSHCFRLVHGTDGPPANCPRRLTLETGRPHTAEVAESRLPGIFEETTSLLSEGERAQGTTVHLLKDLTGQKQAEEEIRRLAYFDTLTGLPNRDLFASRLQEALDRNATGDLLLALFFIDLDGFKLVNDTQGHSAGDRLLQIVARRMAGCLRRTDTVARFGGDEFVICVPNLAGKQDATEIAEKICRVMANPVELDGRRMSCSVSIGIALSPQDGTGGEELLKKADMAMYLAKSRGRNEYKFFSEELGMRARESLAAATATAETEES